MDRKELFALDDDALDAVSGGCGVVTTSLPGSGGIQMDNSRPTPGQSAPETDILAEEVRPLPTF